MNPCNNGTPKLKRCAGQTDEKLPKWAGPADRPSNICCKAALTTTMIHVKCQAQKLGIQLVVTATLEEKLYYPLTLLSLLSRAVVLKWVSFVPGGIFCNV